MIGERRLRVEDRRFLTGKGRYLADHDVPGLCHVAILRSPLAHAVVRHVDTAAAASRPGVVAVVTQADLDANGVRRMGHGLPLPDVQPLSWGLLADTRVRYVGHPLVAVVAETRAIAEDACDVVDVAYDPLPAVVGAEAALADGAPLLHPEWGTNVFLTMAADLDAVDAALADAPHVLEERIETHRVHALPLEGHGAQAVVEPRTGRIEVVASHQRPHQLRTVIAETCGLSEAEVHVVSPDMGGGFGNKEHVLREECLVAALAGLTGRPVRWSQDRREALTAGVHSRPQAHELRVGYDDTGKVLAYRARVTADVGEPTLYPSGAGPALATVGALAGAYDLGTVGFELRCVATTTCPVGTFRGAGQAQAHLSTERVLDRIAAELGLDPVEVRRRNLMPDAPRPWVTAAGAQMDVGPLRPHLDQLVEEFDYGGWRARQATLRDDGRLVGIGISALVQATARSTYGVAGRFGSYETAAVSVLPDGRVTVRVGTKSHGQGHETVFAQVAASALGCDPAAVTVSDGDTDGVAYGMGSSGSRSAVMGGGAVLAAASQVRARVDAICALLPPERRTLADAAAEAWWHPHRLPPSIGPGLTATAVYTPGATVPATDENGNGHGRTHAGEISGAHMTAAAVEVDPATGAVTVLDAMLMSDCGVVINPLVVEGQHQGGFVQGLGAVLHEELAYGPAGAPRAATLADYHAPTAVEAPVLRVVHRQTPSSTAGGFRGVSEAAIVATPAALAGAVADALAPHGIHVTSTRLHAAELRRLLREAGVRPDPAAFARTD